MVAGHVGIHHPRKKRHSINSHQRPDAITLAKAIAGGIACGGLIAKPRFAEKLRPGTHAATFGGNPVACAAALATIETIEADGLLARTPVHGYVGVAQAIMAFDLAEALHRVHTPTLVVVGDKDQGAPVSL